MAELILFTLVRLLLPFTLIVASLSRPVALSMIYLLMFFVSPWLLQTKSYFQRCLLKFFLVFTCILSAIFAIGHLLINFFNLLFPYLDIKPSITIILRQVGFVNFMGLRAIAIFHWILPDIMVTIMTLIVLVFIVLSAKKNSQSKDYKETEITEEYNNEPVTNLRYSEINRLLIIAYIRSVLKTSPIFSLIVLYIAATLRPSLPGSLYFMIFIVAGTYWSLYRQFNCGMHYPLIVVAISLSIQIICFVSYQLPVIQSYLNSESIWARIMGLEALLLLFNRNWNGMILKLNNEIHVDSYLSPVALMWAYFVIALNIMHHRRYKLIFPTMRMKIGPKPDDQPHQLIRQSGQNEIIAVNNEKPSTVEQFFYMICDLTSFIYKNSYILLNIVMMASTTNFISLKKQFILTN
ncbi:piezo-type mechanosensitive ion channel component [Drosophila virilis]|uniref:piezo-type mechanosensitive ion channel component n=1 Tax=Drosophila virilis TaxID=7244 RepID=UPI0013963534|nr:piezo-type mechanosensitive ion channel component [Drosophila virilis]